MKYLCRAFPSNVDKHSKEGETPVRLCNYTDVYYNDTISPSIDFMQATATDDEIARFSLRPATSQSQKTQRQPMILLSRRMCLTVDPGFLRLSFVDSSARARCLRALRQVPSIEPVADRLLKKFAAALKTYRAAEADGDVSAAEAATEEMDALTLFKGNMGAFLRVYTFLSQLRHDQRREAGHLLPPAAAALDFGRERAGIDPSKVRLTHHNLLHKGQRTLRMDGDAATLTPVTEAGSRQVQQR